MFPLQLSSDRRFWRAKCTFGEGLSQWPWGRRGQLPNARLEISLCEADVGEGEQAGEPGDDPADVNRRRWLVGEERIPSSRAPRGAGGVEEVCRLQVEDRPVPEPVGGDQQPATDADVDDGVVGKRLADRQRDASDPGDEEEYQRDHTACHGRET